MRYALPLLLGALLLGSARGQDVKDDDIELDADRKPKTRTGGDVLIKNATVITLGASGTIENGCILVRGGKIVAVGRNIAAPSGVTEIDATSRVVIPGIIDCHSHMANEGGLNEGSQSVTPEVRVRDVVRADDVALYRALAGGETTANLLHGSANAIGGQNAVIKHRWGKAAEQLLFEGAPRGIKFALGENPKQSNWSNRGKRFPNTRMGVEATYRRAFTEAQEYRRTWEEWEQKKEGPPPRRDLRLETLVGIMKGEILVHCHCYRADEILMILQVARDFGFRIATLQHVLEGYKVAHEIAAAGTGASTFSDWWGYKIEAYDATPYNAAMMLDAGVVVTLNSDSDELTRHLYCEAAKAVKYGGVPEIEALKMITLNAAIQLGIDKRVGSIEVGKDADLAIFNGHPLSSYSRCVMTLIDGEVYFEEQRPLPSTAVANFSVAARTRRVPAPLPKESLIAIRHATVFPVTAAPVKDATVLIRDGKIEAVGPDVKVPPEARELDAAGLCVYPGLIDAATTIGLTEIGSVWGTRDEAEIGGMQPDLLVATALNPHSELVPVARANGVTTIVSAPSGGLVCGQGALARLMGWVPSEMALRSPLALHVNVPPTRKPEEPDPNAKEDTRPKDLKEFFAAAKRFLKATDAFKAGTGPRPERDLKLEAMLPYMRGERPVAFNADDVLDILWALKTADEAGVKPIIAGGREAWKCASLLAQKKVPVIVGPVASIPLRRHDPYPAAYRNAARLQREGVPFAIASFSATSVRNLPYEAAMAASYGLPREEALKAVTLYPAQILGVADRLGSIEPGKAATLIVTTGDPLEIVTDVVWEFIDGVPQPLDTRHTRLYEKFSKRPKPQIKRDY